MAGQTKPSAVDDILAEHAGLEQQLSDPALHNDPAAARRVGKRFAELAPVMATYTKLKAAREDLEAARELASDDAAFAAEVPPDSKRPSPNSTRRSPTCSRRVTRTTATTWSSR